MALGRRLRAWFDADLREVNRMRRVAVALLDAALEPGGWLAVFNAHFRMADTPTAAAYEADPFRMTDHAAPDVIWGADNRRINHAPYGDVLFRKRKAT